MPSGTCEYPVALASWPCASGPATRTLLSQSSSCQRTTLGSAYATSYLRMPPGDGAALLRPTLCQASRPCVAQPTTRTASQPPGGFANERTPEFGERSRLRTIAAYVARQLFCERPSARRPGLESARQRLGRLHSHPGVLPTNVPGFGVRAGFERASFARTSATYGIHHPFLDSPRPAFRSPCDANGPVHVPRNRPRRAPPLSESFRIPASPSRPHVRPERAPSILMPPVPCPPCLWRLPSPARVRYCLLPPARGAETSFPVTFRRRPMGSTQRDSHSRSRFVVVPQRAPTASQAAAPTGTRPVRPGPARPPAPCAPTQ